MKQILAIILVIFCLPELKADRWAIAQTREYYSSNRCFMVRIVPIEVPKRYYKWKKAPNWRKNMFSSKDTTIIPCHAEMYKATPNGDSLMWSRELVNNISPITAMVSNNGRYLVTIDEWGGNKEYGRNAIVIYGLKGQLLKQNTLKEISPFPLDSYTASITSIRWYIGSKFIDNKSFIVCFRTKDNKLSKYTYYIDNHELRLTPYNSV